MKSIRQKQSIRNSQAEPKGKPEAIAKRLDQVNIRLNAVVDLLLNIALMDEHYRAVPYTDKAAYLNESKIPIDVISDIVGRPSNYVSSRLREHAGRKYSRSRKPARRARAHR